MARGFDGYKGHVAVDPDSELIVAATVTAGNVGDGQAVDALLADDLANGEEPGGEGEPSAAATQSPSTADDDAGPLSVYGDSAYGAGSVLDTLEQADAQIMCKVQPPNAPGGRYAKDTFGIDLQAGTVVCPAGQTAALRAVKDGHIAHFGAACGDAHSLRGAPPPRRGARSTLASTSSNSPALARGRPTRRGRPTTPPLARRWSARSAI